MFVFISPYKFVLSYYSGVSFAVGVVLICKSIVSLVRVDLSAIICIVSD